MTDSMYPEKIRFNSLPDILVWGYKSGGFNDVFIKSGTPPSIKRNGLIRRFYADSLEEGTLKDLIKESFSVDILNKIINGEPEDTFITIPNPDSIGNEIRFRVNLSSCANPYGGIGVSIVIRGIASKVKSPDEMGVEKEIQNNFLKRNGLSIVSGPVGSGKSTLVSSLLEDTLFNKVKNYVLETAEAPIEYLLCDDYGESNVVTQLSVGKSENIKNGFKSATENTLRRGVDGFFLGEMRDLETIEAGLMAANTGKMVWGTLHVNQISEIPSRIVGVFSPEHQNKISVEFYSVARLLVCQILVPTTDNKSRIAVREWLNLTAEMRNQLRSVSFKEQSKLLLEFTENYGMPMSRYAKQLLEMDKISVETYNYILMGD